MNFNKILLFEEFKSVSELLAGKPDLALLNKTELQEFLTGKIELIELFDENEKKVLTASRKAGHKLGLYCKCCHLIVFNKTGEIFLQKRSQNMDTNPGRITASAAGYMLLNEKPEKAVLREAKEELGTTFNSATFIAKFKIEDKTHKSIIYLFKTKSEGPFSVDKNEIEEAKFYPINAIKKMPKDKFTPAFQNDMEYLF